MTPKFESLTHYRETVASVKREALLKGAIEVFLKQGYAGASIARIARAAGVSSATLYKHFDSKQALFGEVMAQMWGSQGLDALPLADDATPRDALLRVGRDYAMRIMEPYVRPLFRVIIAEGERFPELGQILYDRGKKPYLERLHEYLEAHCRDGKLTIGDIPLAARQFLGMINDVLFWPGLLIVAYAPGEEEVVKVVNEAIETFLARYQAV